MRSALVLTAVLGVALLNACADAPPGPEAAAEPVTVRELQDRISVAAASAGAYEVDVLTTGWEGGAEHQVFRVVLEPHGERVAGTFEVLDETTGEVVPGTAAAAYAGPEGTFITAPEGSLPDASRPWVEVTADATDPFSLAVRPFLHGLPSKLSARAVLEVQPITEITDVEHVEGTTRYVLATPIENAKGFGDADWVEALEAMQAVGADEVVLEVEVDEGWLPLRVVTRMTGDGAEVLAEAEYAWGGVGLLAPPAAHLRSPASAVVLEPTD